MTLLGLPRAAAPLREIARATGLLGGMARAAVPLVGVLPLLLLPRAPAVPATLRVLHVFAGALAVLGGAGFLLGLLAGLPGWRAARRAALAPLAGAVRGRRGLVLVFLIALAAATMVRASLISSDPADPRREHLLTGDEPTYLLITHSLVFDRDLNVFNNREQNDARLFYHRPLLAPGQFGFDFYNRVSGGRLAGREGEWAGREQFVHLPGLPLLLAPAYWAGVRSEGGIRFAVTTWLNLVAAALATVMFALARRVAGDGPAALAALGLALTPPLVYYSSQIYPELPAGLVLVAALVGLARRPGPAGMALAGCLVAYLPWLNERFLGVAAVLAGAALLRARSHRHRAAFLVPIVAALGLLAWHYWHIFGVPVPLNTRKALVPGGIPRGLLALLTDRDKGLAFLNPVLLLAAVGLAPLRARERWLAGTLGVALVVYLLPMAAFPEWYGGVSPPLRYLAPVVPLMVLPLAALLAGTDWPVTRAGLGVLGAWTGWLTLRLAFRPSLWFWSYGAIFEARAVQPAHVLFPGYFHPAPGSVARSLLWLGLLALLPVLDWHRGRRGVPVAEGAIWRSVPVVLTGGLLVVSIASALVA